MPEKKRKDRQRTVSNDQELGNVTLWRECPSSGSGPTTVLSKPGTQPSGGDIASPRYSSTHRRRPTQPMPAAGQSSGRVVARRLEPRCDSLAPVPGLGQSKRECNHTDQATRALAQTTLRCHPRLAIWPWATSAPQSRCNNCSPRTVVQLRPESLLHNAGKPSPLCLNSKKIHHP